MNQPDANIATSPGNQTKRDIASQRHATHFVSILLNANQLYLKGGEGIDRSLSLLDTEWSHIESAQAWSIRDDDNVSAAEACINYSVVGAQILSVRQHPTDRVRWIEAALKCAQRFNVATREAILWNSLGVAYADLNQTIASH